MLELSVRAGCLDLGGQGAWIEGGVGCLDQGSWLGVNVQGLGLGLG